MDGVSGFIYDAEGRILRHASLHEAPCMNKFMRSLTEPPRRGAVICQDWCNTQVGKKGWIMTTSKSETFHQGMVLGANLRRNGKTMQVVAELVNGRGFADSQGNPWSAASIEMALNEATEAGTLDAWRKVLIEKGILASTAIDAQGRSTAS